MIIVKAILQCILLVVAAMLLTVGGCFLSACVLMKKWPIDRYYKQRSESQNYSVLPDISSELVNVVRIAEDPRFYHHKGYDWTSIMWAINRNLELFHIVYGASTITQQLIKNLYFSFKRNALRKISELFLAVKAEKLLCKEQLIELYLNTVYFGNGCWGVSTASRFYFNKEPKQLTTNESVFLCALLPGPTGNNPLLYPEKFVIRRNRLLETLLSHNALSELEMNALKEAHPADNLDEELVRREIPPEGRVLPESNPLACRKLMRRQESFSCGLGAGDP